MLDVRLFLAQRISALIMAPLIFGHLVLIVYANQGGLDAAEILSRTQGSLWWMVYYGVLVLAVSVHAAIGVRAIVFEHLKIVGTSLNVLSIAFGLVLFGMGARAIAAVTM